MEQRARLILNPAARRPPRRDRLRAGLAWLAAHGWQLEVCRTRGPGDATVLAASAAVLGYDAVVAAGGDGTLNEVLNGVAGTRTALAFLPGGTANVWAREARIPDDPVLALRLLAVGERRRIDVGRVGRRRFLLMASAGLDSLVVAGMRHDLKRRFGVIAYLASAAVGLRHYRGVPAEIRIDGERFTTRLLVLVAGNTRSYGGMIAVTRLARADDGRLDVCIYRGEGARSFLGHLVRTALGRHLTHPAVVYRRARQIEIRTTTPLPLQADGELVGFTPAKIAVEPRAVSVVVPASLRSPLFGG